MAIARIGNVAPALLGRLSRLRVSAQRMKERHKDVGSPFQPRDGGAFVGGALVDSADVNECLQAAVRFLANQQRPEGAWRSVTAPSRSITACVVLTYYWLSRLDDVQLVQALAGLSASQNPDGGWSDVAGKPSDLSTTVLTYLVLRISGHSVDAPEIVNARTAIQRLGGVQNANTIARYFLALFGQLPFDACPVFAPEWLVLPRNIPGSLHRKSHWVRILYVPLSILWAQRPQKVVTEQQSVPELFAGRPDDLDRRLTTRSQHAQAWLERTRVRPLRRRALGQAEQWLVDRMVGDGGLCGSVSATLFAMIALVARGHGQTTGPVKRGLVSLQSALVHADDSDSCVAFSSSVINVHDTALAVRALAAQEWTAEALHVRRGIEWLLRRQPDSASDNDPVEGDPDDAVDDEYDTDACEREQVERPSADADDGWCRESHHGQPNVLTTATVLLALREQFSQKPPSTLVTDDSMVAMIRANSLNAAHDQIAVLDRVAAASRLARHWIASLQNQDGGWGHFDRQIGLSGRRSRKSTFDFPDRDASTSACTGRVLRALGAWDMGCGQATIDRAVSYLRSKQLRDGAWPGTHEASAIEATWSVIDGLRAVGLARRDATIAMAANWIAVNVNKDGGWSDEQGEASTPLPTAWAVLALIASGYRDMEVTHRGVRFLEEHQNSDGSWPACDASLRSLNPTLTVRTSLAATTFPTQALSEFARRLVPQRRSGR